MLEKRVVKISTEALKEHGFSGCTCGSQTCLNAKELVREPTEEAFHLSCARAGTITPRQAERCHGGRGGRFPVPTSNR